MNVGGGRSEGSMPQEIVNLITSAAGQMGVGTAQGLFPQLIGQLMGVMTGKGVHEYKRVAGTPGYQEERWVNTGATDDEGKPIMRKQTVSVGGTPEKWEWQPTGEGGVEIPLIAQAQEAQRRATSQAMRGTQEDLARSGLAGTPFGEMVMAQQRQTGAQTVQGVESDFKKMMLSMIPGLVTGNIQSIMGATAGTSETDSKQQQFGFG